ncbi:tyrosinase family protein [Ochrobactrum ciceri]|uniref:Tyrosinase family protein n=1 Tax=Brucella ciceri TaxID=391287 RepID=A0ABX1DXV8_9HYPH|nr:tyrosinase family protein [Brucella ciceri]
MPHGNWWFPVWHRAYLYWFENIIRKLSGDILFTLPYWDWTEYPEIPASMFDGVLTPTDKAYLPYTQDEAVLQILSSPPLLPSGAAWVQCKTIRWSCGDTNPLTICGKLCLVIMETKRPRK